MIQKFKRLYKVIGVERDAKPLPRRYTLGYTSSKAAWLRHPNGWDKKDLEFIRQ